MESNTYGSLYIDSIEFTNEDPTYVEPEEPKMVAYAFKDENMFDLTIDKIGTQYSNLLNANGTTAGDVLPPVEAVDGYENVMKLVPSAGANNGLFNLTAVWYNGARVLTQKVAEGDEIVKVSFWYKAVGSGASRTQDVDIYLNYIGRFVVPEVVVELTEEEKLAEAKRQEKEKKRGKRGQK